MYHPEMNSEAPPLLPNAKPFDNTQPLDAARRRFLAVSTAAGLGGTLFPGALLALAATTAAAQSPAPSDLRGWPAITPEMITAAAAIAAVKLTPEQEQMMLDGVLDQRNSALRVRELHLPDSVAPTAVFNPVPAGTPGPESAPQQPVVLGPAPSIAGISPAHEDQLAFATIRQLGELLRRRKLTSLDLTRLYLARLRRYDPTLHFVITLTEERALAQAAAADRELTAGHDRGPLHGIPWGAKDLLAVKGYPTTWGAAGYEHQAFDEDAEVVQRLDAAGAVLIAKLTMGALAQGDLWGYPAGSGKRGARTRNPWNPQQGSSGSSAGSASATSAGCVAFAIGTETLGSIASPSTRCGVTGLRPSFGLVPRTGAMALSWSMDKIGPIARSVEDCALVLNAIHGPESDPARRDQSVQPAPFHANLTADIRKLRVGYIKSAFDPPTPKPLSADETGSLTPAERTQREQQRRTTFEQRAYDARFNTRALETLRSMGLQLTPVELPSLHFSALLNILSAEAAAAFDDLTTSGRDALLAGQKPFDWPNEFRTSRLIPAVDYIQATRARTLALAAMHQTFAAFDVIVTPSGGPQLTATNLCGQPAVIVPNGLRGPDAPPFAPTADDEWPDYGGPNTPVSLTFLAPLYQDAKAVSLAHAYQQKTGFQLLHPKLA
jgi:Asp-tRNA(Asn)/Glu-tRNA(Gln) amidotransferase A subunit family amidase